MGWQVGFDWTWHRDIGYGVPATCDRPGCGEAIDRGLGYVCGGEPYGGECGCGLFFCGEHLIIGGKGRQRCERCDSEQPPYDPTPDTREWVEHKLTDESWGPWRDENPEAVKQMKAFSDDLDDYVNALLATDPEFARAYYQRCAAEPSPLCINGREYHRRHLARRRRGRR